MREIKFRLIKDGKIVGYEKWYSGSKHSPDSGMKGWAAEPLWLYSFDNKAWGIIYIEHDSKDSSTGLKDKNGKDLDWWEGDVFDLYGSNSPHVIIHKDGCFWFEHLRTKQRILCYKYTEFVDDIPYLGSIYEKPELLEKNNVR